MNRARLSIVSIYIFIALIVLPAFGVQDFLLFSTWRLFDSPPRRPVREIRMSGEQGETFLFRDRGGDVRAAGLKIVTLRFLAEARDIDRLRRDFREDLLQLCKCTALTLIELDGTTADYFIFRKQLPILKETEI